VLACCKVTRYGTEEGEKMEMERKRKLFSTLIGIMIIISLVVNIFLFGPIVMIGKADPGDIPDYWHNLTTLNVTVLHFEPRILFYDFQYNQSGTWVSRLNAQSDVNDSAEYRFIVNISSDQGWDDIEYVNITAWYDQGNDSSTYNQTFGGNWNLYLQYENTTGTAVWRMLWPHGGEFIEGAYADVVEFDPYGSPGFTECHNLSFPFIPSYQVRYAPGDGVWNNTYNTTDDVESWNFNITVDDSGEDAPDPIRIWVTDEFGVYSYSEIVSAGWPVIIGHPGENATANSNITLVTRSNGNYSLSTDVDNLTHKTFPLATISRDRIWVRGGDLDIFDNFTASGGGIYFYGYIGMYHLAQANGTNLITNDVEYKCDIPFGQMAGDYNATIRYHLTTT
jgi:hypothetical protein